ncbi:MAG: hypothetical protein JWR21_1446 [Herminiimonas sp.]|nr:hypothetical protein [Herminiimonas sp.]
MPIDYPNEAELLRAEIAAAAARMIAEDGADYGSAKRKAARQILGDVRVRGDVLPDNAQVEDEVRAYNELFFADTQPARLAQLRALALRVMEDLDGFNPHLTGAALNGTAGEHSDIHLQVFADSTKDVELHLINRGVNYEVSETTHFKGQTDPVPVLSFLSENEIVHVALYHFDDLRGAKKSRDGKRADRADTAAVRALVNAARLP